MHIQYIWILEHIAPTLCLLNIIMRK